MAEKRIPIRTCICCRNEFPKNELRRIVCDKSGNVFYDSTGKADGRGAYVCLNPVCVEKLINKKMLGRVFSKVISQDTYDEIRGQLLGSEKN